MHLGFQRFTFYTITVLALVLGYVSPSDAKPAGRSTTAVTTNTGPSNTNFGFGFATYGGGAGEPSLSGLLEFGDKLALQLLLGITSASPFNFSSGGIIRYALLGNNNVGAFVGFGFTLGTTGGTAAAGAIAGTSPSFFLNFYMPTVGFKFNLGGHVSNLKLSFDGGPMLHVTPSPLQFTLQPINTHIGAALHYFF